jgi:hypothetical protein
MRLRTQGTGSPTHFASKGDTFAFYPEPSEETTITLYYVPYPRVLEDDDDVPIEVPAEWHYLITFWAAWRAGNWDDDGSSSQGERYRGRFDSDIATMKRSMSHKAGHRLAPARVNPRARNYTFSDPSRTSY